MLRYNVGETLFVIHFTLKTDFKKSKVLFKMPYLNIEDEIEKITIKKLVVVEHHKVPNQWQDEHEPSVDNGFILNDSLGVTYYNQCPKAGYGQITTTGDYRFNVHYGNKEDVNKMFDSEEPYEFHLLTDFMDNLEWGISDLLLSKTEASKSYRKKLVNLKNMIVHQFRDEFPDYDLNIKWGKVVDDYKISMPKTEIVKKTTVV